MIDGDTKLVLQLLEDDVENIKSLELISYFRAFIKSQKNPVLTGLFLSAYENGYIKIEKAILIKKEYPLSSSKNIPVLNLRNHSFQKETLQNLFGDKLENFNNEILELKEKIKKLIQV